MLGGSFTDTAKDAVTGAVQSARSEGAPEVRPEHLLLHMLGHPDTPAGRILRDTGVVDERESIEREFQVVRRRGGLTDADAQALEELGIDLDLVVDRVERSSGPEALTEAGRVLRRPWRLGGVPLSGDLAQVLRSAGIEAKEMRSKRLQDTHLLLALLRRSDVVREALERRGLDYGNVRARAAQ